MYDPNSTPRTAPLGALFLLLVLGACSGPNTVAAGDDEATTEPREPTMKHPQTRRVDVADDLHGVKVADPYRWLEDVEDESVQSWMAAQDAFAREHLEQLPARDALLARYAELFYIDAVSTPQRKGERFFLYRRSKDQEKYVVYWKQGDAGEEKVLLDPNTMSEDGSIALGGVYPSHDGEYVAYKLKQNNADEATLYVMEVDTGETSSVDVLPGAKYGRPSWTPDNAGFYYTYLPTEDSIPVEERPGYAEVRFHALGTDPSKDALVRERTGDPKMFVGAGVSRDGEMLFYYKQFGWNATDILYRDAKNPEAPWEPLVEGVQAKFSVQKYGEYLYIHTNQGAPNWKLLRTPSAKPNVEEAQEIVAEQADAVMRSTQVIGGKLVLTYLKNAHSVMRIHELDGTFVRDVELPTVGSTWGMSGDPEHTEAYFTFTSFTTPQQIYKTDIATNTTTLWAKVDVPVDPSKYTVEQVFYPSKDGTKVSMFLVYRKDIPRDGSTPFLLNGYGGFNVSMTPGFRSSIYPWLEAGGGFAMPNLRGGGEYGEDWHKAGMLLNKQNVFDDFIAAAEYLIAQKYTAKERLAISGGSNGGLLVGAVMTQRPDLFRAVICSVPLLDMVRYTLYGSGKTWISEYGDPLNDAEHFRAIHAYSPYHNVSEAEYPATLFMSADSDDRVDPMHARKMAAALQAANTGGEPILLRIEQNAGHGGGDMIKKWVSSYAEQYAFLMKHLGMQQKQR